jgi:hypothetical protein
MARSNTRRVRSPVSFDPSVVESERINAAIRTSPLSASDIEALLAQFEKLEPREPYSAILVELARKVRGERRSTNGRAPPLVQRPPPTAGLALDRLTLDFGLRGIFKFVTGPEWPPDSLDLFAQVRHAVFFASVMAIGHAGIELISMPKHHFCTKRFFDDIQLIAHLIERNREMDRHTATLCVRRIQHVIKIPADATVELKQHLDTLACAIRNYLELYQPERRTSRRNYDPLSHEFIEWMSDQWKRFRHFPERELSRPGLPKADRPNFVRFLACGWMASGLPLEDHRGRSREPLEEWFADRVRKWDRHQE